MTINERIQQRVEELRGACRTHNLSVQELYAEARDEHILALGSRTNEEATEHEINADAYRILAREKEKSLKEKWSDWENGYRVLFNANNEFEKVEVSKEVASKIRNSKDLGDFYACVERFGDNPEEYIWPKEDQERIDALMDDLEYEQGKYDKENIKRILTPEKEKQEQQNEIAPSVLKLNKEKDLHYTNPDDDLEQAISDYLSNTFGYCHFGFKYVDNGENVRVYDIQWDTID